MLAELLWHDAPVHACALWRELVARRDTFITEVSLRQYVGFVRVRRTITHITCTHTPHSFISATFTRITRASQLHSLGHGQEHLSRAGKEEWSKAGKCLYHALHKLSQLWCLARREPITVALHGDQRQFIIDVRTTTDPHARRAAAALAREQVQCDTLS